MPRQGSFRNTGALQVCCPRSSPSRDVCSYLEGLESRNLPRVQPERVDFEAERRKLAGRCFICEMLRGNLDYFHHVVYEDDRTVAFLQRY
jgi:hypothetical protein